VKTSPHLQGNATVPADDATLRGLASAIGIVGPASATALAAFFVADEPFGALNDIGNAALGVLAGALAVDLRRAGSPPGLAGALASGAGVAGAGLTVAGSALVLTDATGFFLAGLVSATGFALLGTWLVTLNRWAATAAPDWPRGLTSLGTAAGSVMAVGLLSVPGVVQRADDMESAPWWLVAGGLGWLGTYVLLPAWTLRLRRTLRRR
jgi:hypothetical protein